jgi:hypothetical protein
MVGTDRKSENENKEVQGKNIKRQRKNGWKQMRKERIGRKKHRNCGQRTIRNTARYTVGARREMRRGWAQAGVTK